MKRCFAWWLAGRKPLEKFSSPPHGTTPKLKPDQIQQLMADKWYVNVHTKANPGGEIRGQVMHGGM